MDRKIMNSLSIEKQKELEGFIKYLDEINHQVGAGKAVKKSSPIEIKIGERVLSLPINIETYNALFEALHAILNG